MEFDDEFTMSDDGGVPHHLGLAKVTQGPPRVKVLFNFRGMKIPITFPPGQIMSWYIRSEEHHSGIFKLN